MLQHVAGIIHKLSVEKEDSSKYRDEHLSRLSIGLRSPTDLYPIIKVIVVVHVLCRLSRPRRQAGERGVS